MFSLLFPLLYGKLFSYKFTCQVQEVTETLTTFYGGAFYESISKTIPTFEKEKNVEKRNLSKGKFQFRVQLQYYQMARNEQKS